ncbi:MAG TPA: UDP-2,3-diacylglucosamine diphosphatase [Planctomycetota bacterium]|nr:UDP-2,3-diacylglucosamine diphosphatase [Planctomycetota bacterium]
MAARRSLFVSDVHLTTRDGDKLTRLVALLEGRLKGGDALYLLGDIFEYWVSDDHMRDPVYARLADELARLVRRGVGVGFVAGNRDYLVGRPFASATGVELLGRSARIELGGRAAHLEHGDMVFNKNWKHAAYRNLMRLGMLRGAAVRIPGRVGHVIGRGMRRLSKATTAAVEWGRDELVERARPMLERGAEVLVFGHLHQPQRIDFESGGRPRTLFILGDWDATGVYLEHDGSNFELRPGF